MYGPKREASGCCGVQCRSARRDFVSQVFRDAAGRSKRRRRRDSRVEDLEEFAGSTRTEARDTEGGITLTAAPRSGPGINMLQCPRAQPSPKSPRSKSPREVLPVSSPATFGSTGPTYSRATASGLDRKSTRLNSSHVSISYAVFCSKK